MTQVEIRWAFYSVQDRDAPVFKQLADQYTMSDNFHQSVMGGTAANHRGAGQPATRSLEQPSTVRVSRPLTLSPTPIRKVPYLGQVHRR